MPNGQPIEGTTLNRLRNWVHEAHSGAGTRLPSERDLANALQITRPELRKSLAFLEGEGLITRHVGRGTFTCAPPLAVQTSGFLADLSERTPPHDVMIARLKLEPELARMAALHASPSQVKQMQNLAAEIRATTSWEDYEKLDFALHDVIAESAGNILLHELHKIMNAVRQVVVWRKLSTGIDGPPADYHSFDEHDAIVAAIANRDCAAAADKMNAHLQATLDAMAA